MSKLQNIIKWLYLNDKGFSSNLEWREKFIGMLEEELEDKIPDFTGGNQTVSYDQCICGSHITAAFPIHGIHPNI